MSGSARTCKQQVNNARASRGSCSHDSPDARLFAPTLAGDTENRPPLIDRGTHSRGGGLGPNQARALALSSVAVTCGVPVRALVISLEAHRRRGGCVLNEREELQRGVGSCGAVRAHVLRAWPRESHRLVATQDDIRGAREREREQRGRERGRAGCSRARVADAARAGCSHCPHRSQPSCR